MEKLIIVLDPGHGGDDRGNVGPTGFVEADGNLKKALYLRGVLETRYTNVIVVLTRDCDTSVSLSARGLAGAGADLFHSIHSNGGPASARGSEVYYSVDLPKDARFAARLAEVYAQAYSTVNRGAKTRESKKEAGEDYYAVMDRAQDTYAKHVLLSEDLFHSNPTEEALLKQDSTLRTFAEVTADVYEDFLPLKRRDSVPKAYQEAWAKAVAIGLEDGIGPNETVTAAKLMKYLDKIGILDMFAQYKREITK